MRDNESGSDHRGGLDLHGEDIDFDLHGLIGIRLVGATPADVGAVQRQLGPLLPCPLGREPDLQVRFVAHLPAPDIRYLEAGRTGFAGGDFFLLSGGGRSGRARLAFESLWDRCEIVCERGIGSVPLLLDLLRLAAIRKGVAPLHASAFEFRGAGALVLGWPHGGKTSALLAFTEEGAAFVGDDLVFLTAGGSRMFGLGAAIDLNDWQLRQVPRLWSKVSATRRLLSAPINWLNRLQRRIPATATASLPARALSAALPPLQRRLRLGLPADVVCAGAASGGTEPTAVFLMIIHESAEIRVEAADPEEMVQRAIDLSRLEALPLLRLSVAYQFAFPQRRSDLLEDFHTREAGLIRGALAGKRMYVVRHPRPVSLRDLYTAMRPVFDESREGPEAVGQERCGSEKAVAAWGAR